jgi:hypothetical protein
MASLGKQYTTGEIEMSYLSKLILLQSVETFAWFLVEKGRDVVSAAERHEGDDAYTPRWHATRWLMDCGQRVERTGERLESWVEKQAARWCIDLDDMLEPFMWAVRR